MKTTLSYDHYFNYAEMKEALENFTQTYPELCHVEANCITPEGREQFAVTLTNTKTGEALSKPGWYLDGNIHAGEVTSSMTAMHTIDYLLTNYGSDETCTKLLDTMTIYVIPRVTPDGAEKYLSTPYTIRSADRVYRPEDGGISGEDLDGDGVIRMMRIPTPYGAWKKDPENEGSMILRDPGETEGEFYDIYPEGDLESYDGEENLKSKKSPWGLDFNRNFPYGWFADHRQSGAGEYPLSNPETKALVDFVIHHPNIGGAAIGHTSGGLILYPPGTRPAKTAFPDDIKAFKAIAEMAKQELNYKPMNIFDSFMTDQDEFDSGAFDDWCFQTKGIPAYTMEFWDLATRAGVPEEWGPEMFNIEKGIQRFNACMKWVKENAPQYYSDWQTFDHPVFGKVELGGFNYKWTHQNPPENFLQEECEKDTRFNIRFAKAMPRLVIDSLQAEEKEPGIFEVTAVIGNLGYLPTNLSDEAIKVKEAKEVKVMIQGGTLLAGKEETEIGHLSGYSRTDTGIHYYGNISTSANAKARKKITWLVKAQKGDTVSVKAVQEKAGTAEKVITI